MDTTKVQVFSTVDQELTALADFFIEKAQKAISEKNKFSVALSGGSSPKRLYQLLASSYKNKLDWNKVYFFFGDERNVPSTHQDSNFMMAKESLFDPLEIPEDHYFAVQTSLGPEKAAANYAKAIQSFFSSQTNFDLVLLGLGDNSHTASLFPHTPILHEKEATVKAVFVEELDSYRISFTAPLINQAENIAFLIFGKGKAKAVKHILKDPYQPEEFPAQLIVSEKGNIQWFLDEAAAEELNSASM